MHLGDVLAGNGFDYKAVVVAGQEAVAEATLRVAVERGAPRQRVLPKKTHHIHSYLEQEPTTTQLPQGLLILNKI